MIHITDGQTDRILAYIDEDNFWDDNHRKSFKDTLETFDFITFADKNFSEFLTDMNRIVIPDEDGTYKEFIIGNTVKYRSGNRLHIEVYTNASYLALRKAKVIYPEKLAGHTPRTAAEFAVADTEWEVGQVHYTGIRSITLEDYTNPYALLKKIATEFDLELRFRVEIDGNKITGRYVDLVERVGVWQGREVEFGTDLLGIERKEDTSNVVTALVGVGPEREDGTRLEVFVEDLDALRRWGRNGRHLIETYEPQSTDQNMTESRLRELTQNELEKRINAVVEYVADIADLEKIPGLEGKEIRYGDTIKIKDTKFVPPLYLEARVHTQDRSIKKDGKKTVVLGDYIEYTEEEVKAIWKQLQEEIRKKISLSEALEVIYTKEEVDERDIPGNEAKEKLDRDVGDAIIESVDGAQQKAEQAEQNAKDHAESIRQQLAAELAKKASQEAVESVQQTVGNLQDTANSLQQAVSDHADELAAQDGRLTTVETDLDTEKGRISAVISDLSTVEDTISQQQTQISANTNAIALKADQSELDTVKGDVSSLSGELNVLAGKVELKAERSEVEALEGDVSRVSNDLAQLTVDVGGISSEVSSVRADLDGLEIGGRNLLREGMIINLIPSSSGQFTTYSTGRGFYIPVTSGEVYSLSRSAATNDRFRYCFSVEEPASGVEWSNMNTHDSKLKVENIVVPEGVNYLFVYIRYQTGDIPKIKLEKGNKATDWTPAPEDVQAEISAVEQYASSIDQKADSISATVSSLQTTVGEHGTQISQAQTDIQVIAGQVSTKAEASEVTALGTKVTTVEQNLSALEGVVETKVDDGEARSIFRQEADSFTFSADQINFDGHVFGQNATFTGDIVSDADAYVGDSLHIGIDSNLGKQIIFYGGTGYNPSTILGARGFIEVQAIDIGLAGTNIGLDATNIGINGTSIDINGNLYVYDDLIVSGTINGTVTYAENAENASRLGGLSASSYARSNHNHDGRYTRNVGGSGNEVGFQISSSGNLAVYRNNVYIGFIPIN